MHLAQPAISFADHLGTEPKQVEHLMQALVSGSGADTMGEITNYHLQTGGRRLRARLSLAVASSLGVEPRRVVPWAAACELLHNATLIHDDLQDGDELRRGQPTVWCRYGMAQAINAGDLLLILPFRALVGLEASGERKWHLAQWLAQAAEKVVRGQAEESGLRGRVGQDGLRDFYSAVARGKTSALFSLPVGGAAYLAEIELEQAQELGEAFAEVGLLFQVIDDLVDFYGIKGRGPGAEDLREGKISSLIVSLLEQDPEAVSVVRAGLALDIGRGKVEDREALRQLLWDREIPTAVQSWAEALADQVQGHLIWQKIPVLLPVAEELVKSVMAQIKGAKR